jgi:hypothetical protein
MQLGMTVPHAVPEDRWVAWPFTWLLSGIWTVVSGIGAEPVMERFEVIVTDEPTTTTLATTITTSNTITTSVAPPSLTTDMKLPIRVKVSSNSLQLTTFLRRTATSR